MSNDSELIEDLVTRARIAQRVYESSQDQGLYDRAAMAVGWALMESTRNMELSRLAVESTGLGNIEDKFAKNLRKTKGLLRDISGIKTCGVIGEENGITSIARPVGVVGAIVPSTNPIATPTNNIINALKCGNSIILSPSPKGASACEKLLEHIHSEFAKTGIDPNLVQMLPLPVSKERASLLMQKVDLLIVTGSSDNVRRAYTSGTPAIGVGVGNASVIVDESANIEDAANKIMLSKTFDNATSCSSENALIVVDSIYEKFMESLSRAGGYHLVGDDAKKLKDTLFTPTGLSRDLLAQDIDIVIEKSGLSLKSDNPIKFLVIDGDGIGTNHPESSEKLSLVVTLYRAQDFESACSLASNLLHHQGAGHSVGIHTAHPDRAITLGLSLPTCRVIVNQAHCYATGGAFDNGMPFSLSMGCGTWGSNAIDDNLHYKHFMNITKVVNPIPPNEPSEEELFTDYWAQAGK